MPVLTQFQMAINALESVQTKYPWTPYIGRQWHYKWPLSKVWNTYIQQAINDGCSHIIMCNDDIIFSPWTVDSMVDAFDIDPAIVMTAGINLRAAYQHDPESIRQIPAPTDVTWAESPDFAMCMVRPDFFEKCGYFDENYDPGYFEDNDMHHRIKLLGYKAITTTAAPYYHFGSSSQNADPGNPLVPGVKFEEIRDYFRIKWGSGEPRDAYFTHPYNNPSLSPKNWLDREGNIQ